MPKASSVILKLSCAATEGKFANEIATDGEAMLGYC
jgi:hypothetical protein